MPSDDAYDVDRGERLSDVTPILAEHRALLDDKRSVVDVRRVALWETGSSP